MKSISHFCGVHFRLRNGNSDDNGDDDGVKSIDHFCGVPLPTCVHRKGDKNDSGENLPCTIRYGNGRNGASS